MGIFGPAANAATAELSLREKVELGIQKSGIDFSTPYHAERLADAIMEVLQPPKPAVAETPVVIMTPVPVETPVVLTEGK